MLVKAIMTPETMQEEFRKMNRDYYSLEGYEAIINLFEEVSADPVELDVIAICCDFTEATPEDILNDYEGTIDREEVTDEEGDINTEKLLDAMNYHTFAQELNNGNILYQCF